MYNHTYICMHPRLEDNHRRLFCGIEAAQEPSNTPDQSTSYTRSCCKAAIAVPRDIVHHSQYVVFF
jgi:hypothetical protein